MPYAHQFSLFAAHLQAIIGQGGYALLFLFTFLEGIPVLGMAVPGHVSIIIGGFFARIGTLNLGWVLLISTVGALLGDFVGFYLGRRYGMSFIDRVRPYFFVTDVHIARAHSLIDRHTGKAMIIGRFTPATRALMPFLVGTSKTSAGKFWLFNFIGGVSWVFSSVMVGYIFGEGYHAAAGVVGKGILIAIVGAIIIIWGYRFVNARYHVFRRYELFTLILNILALGLLALMIQDASSAHPFMINLDVYGNGLANTYNHGTFARDFLGSLAATISSVGGTIVLGTVGFVMTVWYLYRSRYRSALIVVLSLASASVLTGVMKEFFMRSRPLDALQGLADPSFPSGHATLAAAFFVMLAYLIAPKFRSWVVRELFLVFCVIAIILIGLSRVVLNVHWFSDVVGGWALGTFLATASILLVRYVGTLFTRKSL